MSNVLTLYNDVFRFFPEFIELNETTLIIVRLG